MVQPPIALEGQQPPHGGRCYTVAGSHLAATQGLWDFSICVSVVSAEHVNSSPRQEVILKTCM